jgi:hypothetical protein
MREWGQRGRRGAMPFVSECGRRGGGSGSSSGSSLSARRGSDSRAGVLQWDEVEEIDGEVQSSYRGPFDTMDALQDALPNKRSAQSAKARAFVSLVPVIRNRSGFDLVWILRWIVLAFTTSCVIRCSADRRGYNTIECYMDGMM